MGEIQKLLHFRNQIEYINYIGVSQRCNMLFNRAKRQSKRGNVVDCAALLAQLWEMVDSHDRSLYVPFYQKNDDNEQVESFDIRNPIILNSDNNGSINNRKMVELTTNELLLIMRDAHLGYVNYLVNETRNIGNRDQDKILLRRNKEIADKRLLTLVYQNIENIKHYAKRYSIYDETIKQQLKDIWAQKESLYRQN